MMKRYNRYILVATGCILILTFLLNSRQKEFLSLSSPLSNGDIYDETSNLIPNYYDERGCPKVPISFSGMTGRLGNIMSTYVNFIALEYKLGYKYHLPLFINLEPANLSRPFLTQIFKNVSFPTAHWSNFENSNFRDAGDEDVILFNNSRNRDGIGIFGSGIKCFFAIKVEVFSWNTIKR